MRFHRMQNIQNALTYLKRRRIRVVNIRPDDIADGNPKLTLGDGHLTKFVLGAKGRIFRYEKDYAKNLTYNDTLLQENNYTTYKNDRKQIVNTFHQYIDDVRWEEIK